MNQRLPSLKAEEFIRALERAGSAASRTSGSHYRLIHSSKPARKATVPLHSQYRPSSAERGVVSSAKPA